MSVRTCWQLVSTHIILLCVYVCVYVCARMCKSVTSFPQQMLIHIHTLVSLVTTGHHLNHFPVKGHPHPLRREFPPRSYYTR